MSEYRRNRPPRNYFARSEQWRLFMLVMSLGLVFILMNEARKPEHWYWLTGGPQDTEQANAPVEGEPIPWEQWAAQHGQTTEPSDDESEPSEPGGTTPAPSEPPADEQTYSGKYFPGVKPALLGTIRDGTRFRVEEQPAWFNLLAVLKSADPEALRRESIGRIARLQLSEQPKSYRGELVTIRGVVRRAHWLAAPENDQGIAGYYQLWVTPDDSPDWPIVVYCLGLPEGFPTGMNLSRRAMITGFFFKRWLHSSGEGPQLSPVILARGVDEETPKSLFADIPLPGGWGLAAMVGVAALVAVVVVSYVFRRTRRARRRPLPSRMETSGLESSDTGSTPVNPDRED